MTCDVRAAEVRTASQHVGGVLQLGVSPGCRCMLTLRVMYMWLTFFITGRPGKAGTRRDLQIQGTPVPHVSRCSTERSTVSNGHANNPASWQAEAYVGDVGVRFRFTQPG